MKMICRWLKYVSLSSLLFSAVSIFAVAQNAGTSKRLSTNQLLNYVRSIKNPSLQPTLSGKSFQHEKCGFGIRAQVVDRWNEFSLAQQNEILTIMQEDTTLLCYTIIGRFRISYDTNTVRTPALLDGNRQPIPNTWRAYVDSVGRIFNHVWDVEVGQMGYAVPPFEPGQPYYNIYIIEYYGSNYGETNFDNSTLINSGTPPRYWSYITIDNNFQEDQYYSHGINALKVTAAHEFHHAIQIGSYGFWGDNVYAHELTSVWMEDVVYTDVKDYYQYLKDFFGDQYRTIGYWQGLSFNSDFTHGYERCVFAHCIAKIFGTDIMKDIWTGMRTQPFLESANTALVNRGTHLQSVFAEFTKWNYYTADRADTVNYYPEGNHYPRFQPLHKTVFINTDTMVGNVYPLSSSMYEFDALGDSITAIVSNVDLNDAINGNTTLDSINIILSSQSLSLPYYKFKKNGLNAKITPEDTTTWRFAFSQEYTRIDTNVNQKTIHRDASPNPYRLADAKDLLLPINGENATTAEVYFYNSSLYLTYSGRFTGWYVGGNPVIRIPASEIKSKLNSGIYFILAKTIKTTYKWKVAVIR